MHALSCLYIRSERQDGYYHKHNGKEMVTLNSPAYSGSDERLLAHIRKEHLTKRLTLPVRMTARFIPGEEASLTVSCGDIRITLEGNPVQEASRQPISEENVIRQLSKLGDSSFSLDGSIEVELSGNAFYPLKAINELRRRGIALLEEKIILANGFCYERVELQREVQHKTGIADRAQESPQESSIGKKFSILLQTQEQWRGFCRSVFGNGNGEPTARIRLYLDADLLLQDPEAGAEMLKMASEKQIPCGKSCTTLQERIRHVFRDSWQAAWNISDCSANGHCPGKRSSEITVSICGMWKEEISGCSIWMASACRLSLQQRNRRR